jgi:DNA-binding CsgD family transcriptional regulator
VIAATDALELAIQLARVREMGAFIDQTMTALEKALEGSFVSFNRLDLDEQTAMVTFRPFEPGREVAVDGVSRILDEHPLYRWYTSQPDWSPVRISDVMPWEQFRTTRLLREVLAPVGGQHGIMMFVSPPVPHREWVWFMASRADPDFTDAERALCVQLQPALIALYETLSQPSGSTESVVLTRRELDVLRYLAGGLTAETIARRLSVAPATVRKHLQNLYAKLGTSDRLGAVIRARDLGLLHADELSREFTWEIRADLRDVLFRPE